MRGLKKVNMGIKRFLASNRAFCSRIIIFALGSLTGFHISNWLQISYDYRTAVNRCVTIKRIVFDEDAMFERPRQLAEEFTTKQLIYIGVMTARKFLDTRATVVYNSWGKSVPGRVTFFVGNETNSSTTPSFLPVVALKVVDDSYPPQRKSFMMLKHMYDNFIDDYDWFMRCDDDVYVRTDKLEKMLRGFDSSKELYIGQAGQGLPRERGRLGLGPSDNFCMGGPGMVMSKSLLKKLGPHLEYCLKNVLSNHEDVEIGRCIKRHVGVSCTWAFEVSNKLSYIY